MPYEFTRREEILFNVNNIHLATVGINGVELAFMSNGDIWRAVQIDNDSENDIFVKLPCIEHGCTWERDTLDDKLDEVRDAMMVWINNPDHND